MQQSAEQRADDRYKWWVLITVVFGAFASILDTTIVNTALPKIQRSFGADLHLASYVATGYILAAGVVVPAAGFLANRFGSKRVYLWSLILFTFGSALCGIAPNIDLLIAFRVLQGAGGAALFPLSFALLFAAFPTEERGKANGIFGIPVLAAPALGPTLGGYLSEYVDWRWVFYVNLPIGICGVLLGARALREAPMRPDLRFDVSGFLLAASGLGLLLFGLSNLAYDGWSDTQTVSGPILLAVVLLAIFVPQQLRQSQPLLNLRLYARRIYALGSGISILGVISLFGPGFLLPQYLQTLRGQTPFQAGLLLLYLGVGAVIGTIVGGQLYNRVGPRVLMLFGTLMLGITGYLLAEWSTATSTLTLLPLILLPRGFGMPMLLQSSNTIALDGITGRALPDATTLSVVVRNVVASLSIAVLTNYLAGRTTTHLAALGPGRHAPAAILEARALAYHDTYLVTAALILPVLVLILLVRVSQSSATTAASPERQLSKERGARAVGG